MKEDLMRFIYSGYLIKYNKNYERIKNVLDKNELLNFQHSRLKGLLNHSFRNVPYYKNVNKYNQINEEDYISQIPLLNKEIIRNNFQNIMSNDCNNRTWFYNSSGGSTGEPITIVQDVDTIKWGNIAHYYYCKNMLDIDEPRVKKVIIWGAERDIFGEGPMIKDRIYRFITNAQYLNSFRMTENEIEKYIRIINSYKPDLIRSYSSSLYEICKYADEKNIELYKPRVIQCTAEALRDELREKIEESFGIKIYDFYGSREVSSLAGECSEGSLHVFSFKNYIEVLDNNNRPVKPGEEGKIVVTDLSNYSMPLLRYEIGDTAILGSKKCKCGNKLPTLKKVTGRIDDHFVKKDKTIIHGQYFVHLFYYVNWIKKFQVIQEDFEKIKISAVLNSNINELSKKDIENKIKVVMGEKCKVKWEFVDKIPKTRGGKYLYTKSLLH